MAYAAIKIKNPEALTQVLDSLDAAVSESTLRQAAAAGATVFYREMQLRVPVGIRYERKGTVHEPGTLKKSLLVFYNREDSLTGVSATYGVTWSRDAFYGRFVEYGTSRSRARSFLRTSFEAKKEEAARAVIAKIDENIQKAINGGKQ